MKGIFIRIATNNECDFVGCTLMVDEHCVITIGDEPNPSSHSIKSIAIDIATYTSIFAMCEGIQLLLKAEKDFYKCIKKEAIDLLNDVAAQNGSEINTFNLSAYREPRKKMEESLLKLIVGLE